MRATSRKSEETAAEAPMWTPPVAQEAAEAEPRGSRVLIIAGLISIAWAAAAAATIVLLANSRTAPLTLTELAALSAGIAAPLAAIWLAALTIARVAPGQARASLARIEQAEARMAAASIRAREELESIDRALLGVTTRVDGVRASVAARAEELMATVAQLESRSATVSAALGQDRDLVERLMARVADRGLEAQKSFAELAQALPDAESRIAALASALASGGADAKAQVNETEELLAAVWSRGDAARHLAAGEAAKLHEVISGLDAAGTRIADSLGHRAAALEGSVERAMVRTEGALDATRAGVEAQAAAIAAAIEQARVTLGHLGAEADASLTQRLGALAVEAERLAQALGEQEARSTGLLDIAERGFTILDARLNHAAQTTGAALDKIDARIGAARERAGELVAPLTGARDAAKEAEAAVAKLDRAMDQLGSASTETLNDAATRAAALADEAEGRMAALAEGLTALGTRASEVVDLGPLEAARATLAATVEEIGARLAEARTVAAEVEQSAATAASTAATRLVEALSRVHEVSAQAEGAMRRTLEGVIGEAREALSTAGDAVMRDAFAAPIAMQLAEVETAARASADAARAVSERLSRQLLGLVEQASVVEARIAEADARLDQAQEGDLARRASMLLESLNSASIDIAKALSNEVPDTAWAAYQRGDRGIFTRRAVRLLDRGTARAVARRFEEDGEFRDAVRRYVHDFEALLRRAGGDREGAQLAVTLLSSEVGRLYVALGQAIERFKE